MRERRRWQGSKEEGAREMAREWRGGSGEMTKEWLGEEEVRRRGQGEGSGLLGGGKLAGIVAGETRAGTENREETNETDVYVRREGERRKDE